MKKLLLSLLIAPAFVSAQSWVVQNTGFPTASRGINDIHIVDASTVWALAYDGAAPTNVVQEFTKTTDGGNTWTPGLVNIGHPTYTLSNVIALDANTAFVGAFDGDTGLGGVWKTTNGGTTWAQSTPANTYNASGTSWFNFVHFFDATHGITQGDPSPGNRFELKVTSDGGTTWTNPTGLLTMPTAAGEYGYTDLYAAVGNTIWFGTSNGRIFKSTNQGNTWTASQTPVADFTGHQLVFSDANNGLITNGTVYYVTTNGGTTWSASAPWTGLPNISSVPGQANYYVTTGAATGNSGSRFTTNAGTSFTTIDTGVQHTTVTFFDATTGWTGGFVNGGVGGIYKFDGNLRTNDTNAVQVSVTPNPTNGVVTVSGFNVANVSVYDLTGKKVYTKDFASIADASVDISALQTGAYVLTATSDTGATKTTKVLKN
ncbi:T9SS type A sorting domain-containing protein [Flavobacterium sp.]|uniref:T9SS type A sorting domain-containing protein n=1 Tax=Flavobacterium sp. TaxID=239 RepID=UPI00120B402E|nr:T9SS type A sorting domain-containing protein [Flavobacterium sp.]RZJ71362.1 MAG: T9SS type A sorting domain-containing protein [Flavobacterium sp.]